MSLETDLQSVIANTTALNSTVQGKVDEIDAATAASIAATDSRLATFNNTDYPAMQQQISDATSLRATADSENGANTFSYVNTDTTINPTGATSYTPRWRKCIDFNDTDRRNTKTYILYTNQDTNYHRLNNVYMITVSGAFYNFVKNADGSTDSTQPRAWKEGVSITLLSGDGGDDKFYIELDQNRQDADGNSVAGVYFIGGNWGGKNTITLYGNAYPTTDLDNSSVNATMDVPTDSDYRWDPDGNGYFSLLPVPVSMYSTEQVIELDTTKPRYATLTYNTTSGVLDPNGALDNMGVDPGTGVTWDYGGAMTRERLYQTGQFTYEPLA